MLDPQSVSQLTSAVSAPVSGGSKALPDPQAVEQFQQLVNGAGGPGLVDSSLKNFVNNAEERLKVGDVEMSKKVREFHNNHDVEKLISAMHDSSLRSIHVQLTGKIGSKVSESFEQLIKQQ